MNSGLSMDEGFIRRVFKTTIWLSAVVFLLLCTTLDVKLVINYVIGVVFSLGFFKAQEMLVSQWVRVPEKGSPSKFWWIVAMGKYGVLIGVLYLLARLNFFHLLALLGGVVMVQVVILLKVLGMSWVKRMRREQRDQEVKTPHSAREASEGLEAVRRLRQ